MKLNSLTLAKRYSRALFELANEQSELERVNADLNVISEIFKTNPGFVKQLVSPSLPTDAKQTIITVLKQDVSPLVKNFIQMIFEYQHLETLTLVIENFNRLVDKQNRVVHANVITAVELEAVQAQRLTTQLAQYLQADKVILDTLVNPEIIGGIVIYVDGKIIDGSVKSKINKMRHMLVK